MKPNDMQTGHCYVNESRGLVREITCIHTDRYVEYLSYWLTNGSCDGVLGVCQKRTIATWADREATAEEVATLQRSDARTRRQDMERRLLTEVSGAASQEKHDPFEPYFPNGFTIRDEANALVAWAFRNGPLENLHAGRYSELLDDPSLSRITDAEMKALMVYACGQLAELLELKASNPAEYERQIKSYNWRYCRHWER